MNGIRNYFLIFLIAAAVVFVLYQKKPAVYAQLDEWKLVPRPERFTELYFNDHVEMARQVAQGGEINFSFTIRNLEGWETEYPYRAYIKSNDGQITVLDESRAILKDKEQKSIEESYAPASPEEGGVLFVELTELGQELHFSLNNNN